MPLWLKEFAPLLFAFLKRILSSMGAIAGVVVGRRLQREDDQREAIDALQRGSDAGARVKHDDDSVQSDPNNRD